MTTAVVLIALLAAGYGVLRLSGLTLTQARKAWLDSFNASKAARRTERSAE